LNFQAFGRFRRPAKLLSVNQAWLKLLL
jgi:hypothetical protein